jgi:hypothetical protein
VCAYAGAFEPDLVSGTDALAVMQQASAIERAAAMLKAMAAIRVEETSQWKGSGDGSAARLLARNSGTTASAALVEGVGKRPFVPPSDPRHPQNAFKAAERPPPAAA